MRSPSGEDDVWQSDGDSDCSMQNPFPPAGKGYDIYTEVTVPNSIQINAAARAIHPLQVGFTSAPGFAATAPPRRYSKADEHAGKALGLPLRTQPLQRCFMQLVSLKPELLGGSRGTRGSSPTKLRLPKAPLC